MKSNPSDHTLDIVLTYDPLLKYVIIPSSTETLCGLTPLAVVGMQKDPYHGKLYEPHPCFSTSLVYGTVGPVRNYNDELACSQCAIIRSMSETYRLMPMDGEMRVAKWFDIPGIQEQAKPKLVMPPNGHTGVSLRTVVNQILKLSEQTLGS